MTNFNESFTFNSGASLRNRTMMSPMTVLMSFHNGVVTKDEIAYYRERANGVGAVITGAVNIEAIGKGWEGELSIADDKYLPRLTELTTAIHEGGAKAIAQIFHGGRMVEPAAIKGETAVSASAVAAERPGAQTPRAMTEAEILATIKAWGDATRRAIEAGFDGVELHGANTYLLQQFFSPHSNRRDDKWGGSLENRYRFIEESIKSVFEAVKAHATKPFIVGYRFSPEEFENPGIRFEDTLWLLEKLSNLGLDYLHVSLRNYGRFSVSEQYNDKSILQHVHEAIKGRTALVGVGEVRNSKDISNLLEHAELAAIGQQLIVDPSFVEKLVAGKEDEIVTKAFEEAYKDLYLASPLYDFLDARYKSTPLV